MNDSLRTIMVSNPPVVGGTWEIRPTVFVDVPEDEGATDAMQDTLRRRGFAAWVGWCSNGSEVRAVSGTIVLDDESPVSALDAALSSFIEVAGEHGLATRGIHDVVIQPAWRDERDWEQGRPS